MRTQYSKRGYRRAGVESRINGEVHQAVRWVGGWDLDWGKLTGGGDAGCLAERELRGPKGGPGAALLGVIPILALTKLG